MGDSTTQTGSAPEWLAAALDDAARTYGLTPAETGVLEQACAGGASHERIALARSVYSSTVKKQAHHICRAMSARSLADAARVVLWDALQLRHESLSSLGGRGAQAPVSSPTSGDG